ncbi:unnamed protein product [Brassica oleracea]|uniref:(rape) hypothetical protein n=1 Tax=Brassica napus TaxID=3708 RepID=A0A816QRP2_BRANA|nr:unnamed protein product [Brassica napus]
MERNMREVHRTKVSIRVYSRNKKHQLAGKMMTGLVQASSEYRTSSHDLCTNSEAEAVTGEEQATEADCGKIPSVIEPAKAVVSNIMQNLTFHKLLWNIQVLYLF